MKRIKNNFKLTNLYTKLPEDVLDYSDFKTQLYKRLKILKNIESKHTIYNSTIIENERDDIISHFCMRLISAQTLWSSEWFTKYEGILYYKKLADCRDTEIRYYFTDELLKKVTNLIVKKENEQDVIYITQFSKYKPNENNNINFKDCKINIHFTLVHDVLHDNLPIRGYLVAEIEVIRSFITNLYIKMLEEKMNELYQRMKLTPEDRLMKIHNEIFLTKQEDISRCESLFALEYYFPPCMKGLIHKFKKNGHLKHQDRLTLTRFFKECHFSVNETIEFMRNNFKVNETRFNKEYLYSIRHTYGLEGKRANYHSYTCKQIIEKGNNETFGCPFRSNVNYVQEYCDNFSVDFEDIGSCQKSCTKVLSKIIDSKIEDKVKSPIEFSNIFKKHKNDKEKQK